MNIETGSAVMRNQSGLSGEPVSNFVPAASLNSCKRAPNPNALMSLMQAAHQTPTQIVSLIPTPLGVWCALA